MKIRFVTASADPGKDGIGDYTLRLASECAARGHDAEIVAVHDRYTRDIVREEKLLRLPMTMSMDARREAFYEWSEDRTPPDWGSIQFAPYSLHKRGFVYAWADRLRGFAAGQRLQMMIHETWISSEPGNPWHHGIVGAAQRFFMKALVRELAPAPIHTSNENYARALQREGIPASVLPLFGNIPFDLDPCGEAERFLLEQLKLKSRSEAWLAGFFGTLHPVWPPEPLLSRFLEAAKANGKQLCIVSLGRLGSGRALWEQLQRDYAPSIRFIEIGEKTASQLSRFLQQLDFGIATTPYGILGKSGSVAAMREHGLPIIVNRFESAEPGHLPAHIITPSTLERLSTARRGSSVGPARIVDQFIASLA